MFMYFDIAASVHFFNEQAIFCLDLVALNALNLGECSKHCEPTARYLEIVYITSSDAEVEYI